MKGRYEVCGLWPGNAKRPGLGTYPGHPSRPLGLSPEKILEQARRTAHPLKVKTAYITCLKLPERVIYFSIENAELLIAYARERSRILWTDLVDWQILQEKGHLRLQGLYLPPAGVQPAVLFNAEDYFINRHLLPERYWPACLLNAGCAVAIRTVAPVPAGLRDAYFYLTLATFLAYEAVAPDDLVFLNPREVEAVAACAELLRKIKEVQDIPPVCQEIERSGKRLWSKQGR